MTIRRFVAGAAISIIGGFCVASAQAVEVKPTQGQSPEQMTKDIAECQGLATQSSGYNPGAPPAPVSSAPPAVGGRLKGAAVGGAAGSVAAGARGGEVYDNASDDAQQEYRQNQAQGAAAAGAVVGASRQRQQRRANREADQQATAQAQSQAAAYDSANQGCLAGRGYSVTP
jgi:hypothetical protein